MFTYTLKNTKVKGNLVDIWTVRLDNKEVGRIQRVDEGYQYRPKGLYAEKHADKNVWGLIFISFNQCKKSLESEG